MNVLAPHLPALQVVVPMLVAALVMSAAAAGPGLDGVHGRQLPWRSRSPYS